MLILMKAHASEKEIDDVCQSIEEHGFKPVKLPGADSR